MIKNVDIKGHCEVKLYNGGKVDTKIEGDNFVGVSAKKRLFSIMLSPITNYFHDNNRREGISYPNDVFGRLGIFTNGDIVQANALDMPEGDEIGYALRTTYSGSDSKRGTLNLSESEVTFDKIKLVFDFPTHAANGTFQTVGFYRSGSINSGSARLWDAGKIAYDDATDILYLVTSSAVKKIESDGSLTDMDLNIGGVSSCCVYNNILYYSKYNNNYGVVYSRDMQTGTETQIYNGDFRYRDDAIAFDGMYFYHSQYRSWSPSARRVRRFDVNYNLISSRTMNDRFYQWSYKNGYLHHMRKKIDILDLFDEGIIPPDDFRMPFSGSSVGGAMRYKGKIYCGQINYALPVNQRDNAQYTGSWAGIIDDNTGSLGTCVLLPAPVTKEDSQTMKVTYTFTFSI